MSGEIKATQIANAAITNDKLGMGSWMSLYGTGGDGNHTDAWNMFDALGANTPNCGAVWDGVKWVATRDIHLINGVVELGAILNMAGFRLFATGTLTNYGSINNDGIAGANAVAGVAGIGGAAPPAGTLAGGAVGKDGKDHNVGVGDIGTAATASLGNFGGLGGGSNLVPDIGASSVTSLTAAEGFLGIPGLWVGFPILNTGRKLDGTLVYGGAGGSGGGGGADNAGTGGGGGGSGSSGGPVIICARRIAGDGEITSYGGAGGNGGEGIGGGDGGGGGGGGGAGYVIVVTDDSSGWLGASAAVGGAHGLGGAGTSIVPGNNGGDGGNGTIALVQLAG